LLLPEDKKYLFTIIGDFSYFIGLRIHLNIGFGLSILLALTSQLIYFYNYKSGIKPTYLKVFEMMSGLVSPKSIGLTNKKEIYKLLKESKMLFRFAQLNNDIFVFVIALIKSLWPLIKNCSVLDLIIFGIPNSLLFAFCCHCIANINLWQIIYFYIMCSYIKIKIKELNKKLKNIIRKGNKTNGRLIEKFIHSLNSIHNEINEYNISFWSKYLLSIWLIFGSSTILCLYCALFIKMNLIYKLILLYLSFLFITLFVFIANMASSVNSEANKSYKLLNEIIILNNKSYLLPTNYYRLSRNLKVIQFF
jgi:hypothetical protein